MATNYILSPIRPEITGGKFQNGAVTAAFGYLLNHCAAGTGPGCGGNSGYEHDHAGNPIGSVEAHAELLGGLTVARFLGPIYSIGRAIYGAFAKDSVTITFKSEHGARHLVGTNLKSGSVERVIRSRISEQMNTTPTPQAQGSF